MIRQLYLIGLNHKTAPIELRESYLRHVGEVSTALAKLKKLSGQCAIISTCNRFEMLYTNESPLSLEELTPGWTKSLKNHYYQLHGVSALQHLFEVTASLDSLVVGETEILGQVRKAYELAEAHKCVDSFFHSIFQNAIAAAKKIHNETELGKGHVSVGSVAVDLCKEVFEHVESKEFLLLGSGDIGRVVLENLKAHGAKNIKIASRTLENSMKLAADLGGSTVPWENWQDHIAVSDIIITAASTPEPILSKALLKDKQKQRHYQPLLIVDLAVPRNVEESVDNIRSVYRYDVDGLSDIIDANTSNRHLLINDCRMRLTEEAQNVIDQFSSRNMGDVYRDLDGRVNDLQREEFEKIKNQLPEEYHELLRQSLRRFSNKILHPLKKNAPKVVENKEDLKKILFGENHGGNS